MSGGAPAPPPKPAAPARTIRGAPPGQGGPPSMPEVAKLMQQTVHKKMFSAIACLGARDGRIMHVSAHGSPQMPPPARPVVPGCLFDLGQLTGSLSVSVAVAFLMGRGRLDLTMPLSRALPDTAGTVLADIPLDMLLDHTSGLDGPADLLGPVLEADRRRIGEARVIGSHKAAAELWTQLTLQMQPRGGPVQSVYNPLNTHLMSLAIASLVQKPFETWLIKDLYAALGLGDALHYVPYPLPRDHTKKPYVATAVCPLRKHLLVGEVQDPLAYALGGAAGHAGLFGNTLGVFRVLEALRQGAKGQQRMLHAGTLTRLWTRLRRTGDSPWTLGWQSMTKHSPLGQGRWHPTSIGHIDVEGGCAYLIDPSQNQVCILLSNPAQSPTKLDPEAWLKLCRRIFDAFVTLK